VPFPVMVKHITGEGTGSAAKEIDKPNSVPLRVVIIYLGR